MNRTVPARSVGAERIPGQLLRPFGMLPRGLTQQTFVLLCNQAFSAARAAGDLDFLAGRVLRIELHDAGIALRVSLHGRRLIAAGVRQPGDVRICGDAFAFLLLASRREDPDSLFFQRRLRIQGDTELGLHVKNFLDAWEAPAPVRGLQRLAAAMLERLSP